MNVELLMRDAIADGISFSLRETGKAVAAGPKPALAKWVPILQPYKLEIAQMLRRELRPTKEESLAELRRLVQEVAKHHGFTDQETEEAMQNALRDWESALTCFRALRREF